MGSNYFSRCGLQGRFTCSEKIGPLFGNESAGEEWVVDDWDQRRCIDVHVPSVGQVNETFILKAVEKFIDTLPPGVVDVGISNDGSLVSTNRPAEPIEDTHSWAPLYPARTEFPEQVPTVRREELTECVRLGRQVDLVTHSARLGETKAVVFKYNITGTGVAIMWHETNCVMRMPPHPNIVPFDSLVVDSVDDVDSVVGFTTRYIPGGTLSENQDRVFKLKYLEQLISAVDHLNLRLGIVHGDICPSNLAIDAETDSIQLFDFNRAAKLGWEGDKENHHAFKYEETRNDIKFVMLTVQELITRELYLHLDVQPHGLDVSQSMIKKDWVPHQDAKLDSPVEEYRRVLDEWIQRRAEVGIDHFSKASEPLDWPPLVANQFMRFVPWKLGRPRALMTIFGRKYLTWERPPTTSLPLPKGKRLLATGKVVHEPDDAEGDGGGSSSVGK